MSTSAKYYIMFLSDKRVRNVLIGILIGIILLIVMVVGISFYESQSSTTSQAAGIAEQEYRFWQNNTPESQNYSCQGEKYCSYYNSGITDWCCFFAGYCYKEGGLTDEESCYSSTTNGWISNLSSNNLLYDASSYVPKVGNPVFFNYDGRANYALTGFVAHVGIVVAVSDDTITVIAGNEYNGQTSNWADVSYVNKYELSLSDDSIACYGDVGSVSAVSSTGLNAITRNVICHNEVGFLYDELPGEDYGSVIANDNGALSVGVYGWHGNKALSLLQLTYNNNSSEFVDITTSYAEAGQKILNDVTSGSGWAYYIPNVRERNCIKALLLTDAGKQAQDTTSLQDAENYVNICIDNGLTDNKVIVYCSDILNQYGTGSFNANVYGNDSHGVLYGVTSSMSLDDIYNSQRAWHDRNYSYTTRRSWTYNYLNSLEESAFTE